MLRDCFSSRSRSRLKPHRSDSGMTSSRHHNIYIDGAVCFWASSIVGRRPVFRSSTAARRAKAVLDQCRGRHGVTLVGYVLMPEHIHRAVWAERAETVQLLLRQSLRMAGRASKVVLRDEKQSRSIASEERQNQLHFGEGNGLRRGSLGVTKPYHGTISDSHNRR